MSDRAMWKMLHLLYNLRPGQPGLTYQQLESAGIDCGPDTIYPLEASGAVSSDGGVYSLTKPAQALLRTCMVANKRWSSDDLWVDFPSAFVIMPFSAPWSDEVFQQLITVAASHAKIACVRGDQVPRLGDLGQNLWNTILHAGIVIADVTGGNANVFYELGLVHALGKDAIILRQKGSAIPADIGGSHWHEYDLASLDDSVNWLANELGSWADEHCAFGVKTALGR